MTFSISYTTNSQKSSSSPWNFSSMNIGTADPERTVIVGIAARTNSNTITGCYIGGIPASEIYKQTAVGYTMGFYSAPIESGTTANIAIYAPTSNLVSITVFRAIDFGSSSGPDASVANGDINWTGNIDCLQNGALLGLEMYGHYYPASNTQIWRVSSALESLPSGASGRTVGTNQSNTNIVWTGLTEEFDSLWTPSFQSNISITLVISIHGSDKTKMMLMF